ncbi:hypothetical protein PG984_015512 [Apiospora sp. TS-2023a]
MPANLPFHVPIQSTERRGRDNLLLWGRGVPVPKELSRWLRVLHPGVPALAQALFKGNDDPRPHLQRVDKVQHGLHLLAVFERLGLAGAPEEQEKFSLEPHRRDVQPLDHLQQVVDLALRHGGIAPGALGGDDLEPQVALWGVAEDVEPQVLLLRGAEELGAPRTARAAYVLKLASNIHGVDVVARGALAKLFNCREEQLGAAWPSRCRPYTLHAPVRVGRLTLVVRHDRLDFMANKLPVQVINHRQKPRPGRAVRLVAQRQRHPLAPETEAEDEHERNAVLAGHFLALVPQRLQDGREPIALVRVEGLLLNAVDAGMLKEGVLARDPHEVVDRQAFEYLVDFGNQLGVFIPDGLVIDVVVKQ